MVVIVSVSLVAIAAFFLGAWYGLRQALGQSSTQQEATENARPEAPKAARIATVQLTALGEGGTWYTIDGDIREGDTKLSERIGELVGEARKEGKRLVVKFEVAEGAGITGAHLTQAGKVCAAAGAEIEKKAP